MTSLTIFCCRYDPSDYIAIRNYYCLSSQSIDRSIKSINQSRATSSITVKWEIISWFSSVSPNFGPTIRPKGSARVFSATSFQVPSSNAGQGSQCRPVGLSRYVAHQPSPEGSQQFWVLKVTAGIAKSTTTPAHMGTSSVRSLCPNQAITHPYTVRLTKRFHSDSVSQAPSALSDHWGSVICSTRTIYVAILNGL